MKKYFLYFTAVVTLISMIFTTSCQRVENPSAIGVESEVTFSVSTPDIQTRAYSDGTTANKLTVAVYNGESLLFTEDAVMQGTQANVTLTLVNGMNYNIVFWAQAAGAPYTFSPEDRTMTVNYNGVHANDENLDAFWKKIEYKSEGAKTQKVELTRPFAQLNIAANDWDEALELSKVEVKQSKVKVEKVYSQMDMFTGDVADEVAVEFGMNTTPNSVGEKLSGYTEGYHWLAMNYLLVDEQELVVVTFNTDCPSYVSEKVYRDIPVKRNYRTNIYGKILTSDTEFDVETKPGFDDEDKDIYVYEDVTYVPVADADAANMAFAAGAKAVAINLIDADAEIILPSTTEDVYLLLPSTDKKVDIKYATIGEKPGKLYVTIPEGVVSTLNIDATESTVYLNGDVTTLTAGTAQNTLYIVGGKVETLNVAAGNVVVENYSEISNIYRTDENTDETTIVTVSETASAPKDTNDQDQLVIKEPVKQYVSTFAELQNAIASPLTTIYLTSDIEASEVISIKRSITIEGENHSLTTSAKRALEISQSSIEVTINNLNIELTAERIDLNDLRGIALANSYTDVVLTLNNCNVDFTDESAHDWTYAVNQAGNSYNNTINIVGGSYEGANPINIWGYNHNISIQGASLKTLYKPATYGGVCIRLNHNDSNPSNNNKVTISDVTFDGTITDNLGYYAVMDEKDSEDNHFYVESARFVNDSKLAAMFDIKGKVHVESAEVLNEILKRTNNDLNVMLDGKIEGDITISQEEGEDIIIDGQEKKYDGTIYIHGNARHTGEETLTITNVNFEHSNGSIDFISCNDAHSSTIRYAHNVTVENCTFIGNGRHEDAPVVGMRYRQCFNMKVVDCTAQNLHSLMWATGSTGIEIKNVTVKESLNGASFGTSTGVTVTDSEIDVVEHGVRADGVENGKVEVSASTIKANQPVIVRKMTHNKYTVDVNGSKLVTDEPYHVVFTKGADDAEYVKPEGECVIENAERLSVYPLSLVNNADELVSALESNLNVVLQDNIKIDPANMSNAYGTTGINVKNGQTIDGGEYTLDIKGAGGTWDSGINTTGGLIKNLTVTGSFRGIFINHNSTHSEKVFLENVTIEGTVYTISCDQGTNSGLEAKNSTFNGWTSYAATLGPAIFTECSFGKGNGYAFCRPYAPTVFVGCDFEEGYRLDPRAAVTFENCTIGGVDLTAENLSTLVTNEANVTVK